MRRRSDGAIGPGDVTRGRRWLRFLGSVLVLLTILVGLPAGLIAMSQVGLTAWHPVPSVGPADEVREWFDRELTATEIAPILLRVLLAACWLLWASLMSSVLAAMLSSRPKLGRIRLPRPAMFESIGVWIAAGLTSLSSFTPNIAAASADAAPLAPIVQEIDDSSAQESHGGAELVSIQPGHERVMHGESIEMFAARTLGDSGRWSEIWQLNQGRVMDEVGTTWSEPWRLAGGWQLELPVSASSTSVEAADVGVEERQRQRTNAGLGTPLPPPEITEHPVLEAAIGDTMMSPARSGEPDEAGDVVDDDVRTYVVQAGDGPWDVAEALLGDGMLFQEVLDANVGHEVAPGHVWTSDQRVIHPGWVFSWGPGIEPKAPEQADQPQVAETRDVHVIVESGDTLWGILDEHSGRDANWGEVERAAARNDGVATPDRVFTFDASNPNLIHPGQEFVIEQTQWAPPAGAPQDGSADPATPKTGGGGDRNQTQGEKAETGTASDVADGGVVDEPALELPKGEDSGDPQSPPTTEPATAIDDDSSGRGMALPGPVTWGLGVAALSAGLVALLEVSRRRRLRSAQIRDRLRMPPGGLVDTERHLRQLGDAERLVRVDVAVRTAVESLLQAGRRVATVTVERDGAVILRTDDPLNSDGLPSPWESADGSRSCWKLPGTVTLEELADAGSLVAAPCPGLTPIGTSPSGGDVFVDVECAEVLWLDVTEAEADRVLRGVCAGLGSSVFAERASLIGVGVDPAWFLGHPNACQVNSVAEAVGLAARQVGPTDAMRDSTFALRARQTSGESWQPAVVVVDADHVEEMAAVRPMPGMAIVVAGDPVDGGHSGDTGWVMRPVLDVDSADDSWRLEPLGLSVSPVGLAADEFAAVDELLRWERSPALPPPPPGQQPIASPTEHQTTAPHDADVADAATVEGATQQRSSGDPAGSTAVVGSSDDRSSATDDASLAPVESPSPVSDAGVQHRPVTPRAESPDTSTASHGDGALADDASDEPASGGDTPDTETDAAAAGRHSPLTTHDDDDHRHDDEHAGGTEGSGVPGETDVELVDAAQGVTGVVEPPPDAESDVLPRAATSTLTPSFELTPSEEMPSSADDQVDHPAVSVPDPDWSLMVRVFGLVDVVDRDGNAAEFRKAKSLELLTWLSLHRDRATRAGARSALWEVDVTDATFSNVVSEVRRALNKLQDAPEDTEWLGRTLSAGLPLHDHVISDVELIEARIERSRQQPTRDAITTLRSAAELIRGLPFAESGYVWPDAEGITSRLVVLATSVTSELAEKMLQVGDVDGVLWATGIGLRVLAGHEDLIALRMRAHATRGDRAGVRHEWESYERVLAADTWSDGEPSPILVELRQQLLNAAVQRTAEIG